MKENLWLTLFTCLAYCVDKELWKAIDYLKGQVRVLKEQQEKDKRILLDNRQRTRLAAKAKRLTQELLEATTVLFTPDTILGWCRKLIAQKYDGSENCRNPGRPRMSQEIIDLVIRFKKENPHWGYAICAVSARTDHLNSMPPKQWTWVGPLPRSISALSACPLDHLGHQGSSLPRKLRLLKFIETHMGVEADVRQVARGTAAVHPGIQRR
jgi:hypothetical protein